MKYIHLIEIFECDEFFPKNLSRKTAIGMREIRMKTQLFIVVVTSTRLRRLGDARFLWERKKSTKHNK